MRKRSGPTLYEVMSQSPATPATRTGRREPASEPDRPSTPRMLTPGSVVRLPVGFIWLGVVVVVAGAIGLYVLGRSHGEDSMRQTLEAQASGGVATSARESRLREPQDPSIVAVGGEVPGPSSRRVGSGVGTRASIETAVGGVSEVDVMEDRRVAGHTYHYILYTTVPKARRVAEEVVRRGADLGLDAMVLQSNNGRSAHVVLLPSVDDRPDLTSEAWKQMISALGSRFVGDDEFEWNSRVPFHDYYQRTF